MKIEGSSLKQKLAAAALAFGISTGAAGSISANDGLSAVNGENISTSIADDVAAMEERNAQTWEKARLRFEAQKSKAVSEISINDIQISNEVPFVAQLDDERRKFSKITSEADRLFRKGDVQVNLIMVAPPHPADLNSNASEGQAGKWTDEVKNNLKALQAMSHKVMRAAKEKGATIDKVWIVKENPSLPSEEGYKAGDTYLHIGGQGSTPFFLEFDWDDWNLNNKVNMKNWQKLGSALVLYFGGGRHMTPTGEFLPATGLADLGSNDNSGSSGSSDSGSGEGSAGAVSEEQEMTL